MEETKTESKKLEKQKKQESAKPIDPRTVKMIQELIDIGIPLRKVVFARSVISLHNEPEFAFYTPEPNVRPSRTAKMWYTPHGVLCEQKCGYKLIPLANVLDTTVL